MTAPAGRPVALVALAVGAIATLLFGTGLVGLLRDVTRFGCTYTPSGEGRGWFCGDGIGYILPGLGILLLLGAIGVAAVFVTVLAGRRAGVALVVLAALPLIVGGLASGWALLRAVGYGYEPAPYAEAWLAGMPVSIAALATSTGLLIAAARAGTRPGHGAWAGRLAVIAAAVSLAGVILQPGLAAPVVASWTIVVAALARGLTRP